jgi:pimeloyl-ACP methyl ester carboxylesterase
MPPCCFLQPPVLVLWGRQDRILPPATAQQFADALPGATVTYLENSGHSGHLEEPQATADAIMQFVSSCRTTQP